MQIMGSASPVFAQTEGTGGGYNHGRSRVQDPSLSCCKSRRSGMGEILQENFNESYK